MKPLALVSACALVLGLPGASGAFEVTFGTSWGNASLQSVLDAEYGPGTIDVATDYEGYNPGDGDPAYWLDSGMDGLIVREIAGFSSQNPGMVRGESGRPTGHRRDR